MWDSWELTSGRSYLPSPLPTLCARVPAPASPADHPFSLELLSPDKARGVGIYSQLAFLSEQVTTGWQPCTSGEDGFILIMLIVPLY